MYHSNTFLLSFVFTVIAYLFSALLPGNLLAEEGAGLQPGKITSRMQSVIATHTLRIKEWAASPLLIEAVREQNLKNTGLAEIKRIDEEWLNGRA